MCQYFGENLKMKKKNIFIRSDIFISKSNCSTNSIRKDFPRIVPEQNVHIGIPPST